MNGPIVNWYLPGICSNILPPSKQYLRPFQYKQMQDDPRDHMPDMLLGNPGEIRNHHACHTVKSPNCKYGSVIPRKSITSRRVAISVVSQLTALMFDDYSYPSVFLS